MQALFAKVMALLAERCDVYGIPFDPDSKDFWRLMTYSFVFEYLIAEHRPPARGRRKRSLSGGRMTREENYSWQRSFRF